MTSFVPAISFGAKDLPVPAGPGAAGAAPGQAAAAALGKAEGDSLAASAASSVRWSEHMLQTLRMQAFEQLVARLAQQIQAGSAPGALPWPASGVSAPLTLLLQSLLGRVQTQAGMALELVAAQPGSTALLQALVAASPAPASASGASPEGIGAEAARPLQSVPAQARPSQSASFPDAPARTFLEPALPAPVAAAPVQRPPLQTWWVQQGLLQTPEGERGFAISLQVPVGWAQAQGAAQVQAGPAASAAPSSGLPASPAVASAALPAPGVLPGGGMRLVLDVPLPQLASGAVALVLQPHGDATRRSSALLLLELEPLPGAQQAMGGVLATLSAAQVQQMQQLALQRGDPWLQMAAAQSSGQLAAHLPRERGPLGSHESHFCSTEGCQYQGRAPCAQPFCSEMNRLWALARS